MLLNEMETRVNELFENAQSKILSYNTYYIQEKYYEVIPNILEEINKIIIDICFPILLEMFEHNEIQPISTFSNKKIDTQVGITFIDIDHEYISLITIVNIAQLSHQISLMNKKFETSCMKLILKHFGELNSYQLSLVMTLLEKENSKLFQIKQSKWGDIAFNFPPFNIIGFLIALDNLISKKEINNARIMLHRNLNSFNIDIQYDCEWDHIYPDSSISILLSKKII